MGSRTSGFGKWVSAIGSSKPDLSGSGYTATTYTSFTAPATNGTVSITFSTTAWMVAGIYLYFTGAGTGGSTPGGQFYQVASITSGNVAVCTNNAPTGWTNSTSTIATGNALVALQQPVTLTTDDFSQIGFEIAETSSTPLTQALLRVTDKSDVDRFVVYPAGGTHVIGQSMRVYNTAGGSYAALNGAQSVPCVELPDGPTNQGSKIWGGSGPPDSTVVGTPTKGDFYQCRSSAYVIAASWSTTRHISVGAGTLTYGTALVAASVQAGDLLVLAICGPTGQTTLTAPTTASGATAASVDGGYTAPLVGATRRVFFFSHVVQSADVVAGQVQVSTGANPGTGGILVVYAFRHPNGWPTTGSFFGCPLSGTPAGGGYSTTSTSPISLATTGSVTLPTVSVAAVMQSVNSLQDFAWGSGISSPTFFGLDGADQPPPTGTNLAGVCAKPGIGSNVSGQTCLPTGNASVVVESPAGVSTAGLAAWSPVSTPSSSLNPQWYTYTGSAWVQVI